MRLSVTNQTTTESRHVNAAFAGRHDRIATPAPFVAVSDAVARWAARSIEMGGQHQFTPYVLGPSGVPRVTDEVQACENPELAVLSAMAHGREANLERVLAIALAAQKATAGLDADRSKIYFDLIMSSLGEAARQALEKMDARNYEYQSDFARRYVAQGRAAVIVRLLTVRFGILDPGLETRIQQASVAELDAIAERVLSACTLQQALG